MTTFDNREKAFENKYALDEELSFKANARRNKLLGLWAAQILEKPEEEAQHYAKDIVMADFESDGDQDVVNRLLADFARAGKPISEAEIRAEMDRLMQVAREQVLSDRK
jgi:hypothetical protein